MRNTIPVAVICVTFNSADVIGEMIDALPAALGRVDHRVIIVDNASEDETLEVIRQRCPGGTVVASDTNDGFAAGVNRGLQELGAGEAALLVNPDARLASGSVEELCEVLAERDIGIVAPRLVEADGSLYPSLRRDAAIRRVLLAAILGDRRAGRVPGGGELIVGRRAYREPRDVAWAGGAVLLLRPGLTDAIGVLDESFFLYSEETEYCLRARRHGYRVRYQPSAVAVHLGGGSTSSPSLYRLMVANRLRLYARLHPRWQARGYRAALMLHQQLRALRGDRLARQGVDVLRDTGLLDG